LLDRFITFFIRMSFAMWITFPQAVSIYARYFRARHGPNASKIAVDKAQQLKERGDLQGHQIWSDVAREIERLTGSL
jgi:hypothetical protein